MAIRIPKKPSIIVDKLGELKAVISGLQEEERALRQALVDSGEVEVNGDLFRATVSLHSGSERVNWKGVAEEFEIPKSVIRKHTKTSAPSYQVKVVARIIEE
jgi:hypothetical protein